MKCFFKRRFLSVSIRHDISNPYIISRKMDTNFGLLLNIDNKSEQVSKNPKFRYLYLIEVRNHDIYIWNKLYGSVEKILFC